MSSVAEPCYGSHRVLIAGCGDLGCTAGEILASAGMDVFGLRRNTAALPKELQPLQGDVTEPATLPDLNALAPQILIYCVAADAQTDDSYRRHYVDGLRNVLFALQGASQLQHVFFVSSTRVYGQSGGEVLDETHPAIPADFGGERLLEGERLLSSYPLIGTVLRLSGIYGPGRKYLLSMAVDPTRWPDRNAWSNRIHRDDAAGFIAFLVQQKLAGKPIDPCYLVTDDCPVPQHEVLRWLAARLNTSPPDTPSPAPSGGKRLSNARLRATGYELRHPDYQSGYGSMTP